MLIPRKLLFISALTKEMKGLCLPVRTKSFYLEIEKNFIKNRRKIEE